MKPASIYRAESDPRLHRRPARGLRHDRPAILAAEIDPAARGKNASSTFPENIEIDRVNDRRPETYGLLSGALPPRS